MYKHNCIEEERRQQSQFNAEGAERRRARSRPMQARSRPMRRAQMSAQSSNAGATAPSVLADDTDERSATQCKRRRAQTSAQSSDADDTHESSQAIVTDEQSTARTDDTDE